MTRIATFGIRRNSAGQFFYRLVAPNGQIIMTGHETYTRKASCKRAIDTAKKYVSAANVIDETN